MQVLERRVACGIALSIALTSCGMLVAIGGDTNIPDRADADADADASGAASANPDAHDDARIGDASLDACALPATCAPELVTKLGGGVFRLVAVGGALYAGAADGAGSPHVYRITLTAPPVVLDLDPHASAVEQPRPNTNIVIDTSGAVYWGTPNGLRRREPGAGADPSDDAGITSLVDLGAPVSAVRIFGGSLAFGVDGPSAGATPNGGHLATCALPGCSDVMYAVSSTPFATDLMRFGAAYVWFGTDASLQGFGLRTTGNVLVGGEQHQPSRMATDGTHLYWSAVEGLRSFTPPGSSITELLAAPTTVASRVNGIAVDADGTLYLTQGAALLRCSVSGSVCTPKTLATGPGTAVDVAVDATFAYWGTSDGSILRFRIH